MNDDLYECINDVTKKTGLEANAEETKQEMLLSRPKNLRRNLL
jgi:hypothetical protein